MPRCLGLVAVLLAACSDAPAKTHADAVYTGGKVFVRAGEDFAEAFAVKDGKVLLVGSSSEVESLAGEGTTRTALGGRVVFAGFTDAHAHVAPLGAPDWFVNTPDFAPGPGPSAQEIATLARAAAQSRPPGTPILAIISSRFYATAGSDPRDLLDAAAPNNPVLCVDWSGHGTAANSAMLAAAGYLDGQPDPYGGRLSRDVTGRLTGYVQELAEVALFRALSEAIPTEAYAGAYDGYARGALRFGFTSVVDIPFVLSGERAAQVHAMQTTRLAFVPVCLVDKAGTTCAAGPDGVIRRKVFIDGGPVDCSSLVSVPYRAPDSCPNAGAGWLGLQDLTDEQLDAVLGDTLVRGGHLLAHAVGDAAVAQLLGRMESRKGAEWKGKVTLEHGDMISPADVARAARLGVAVVQNATHLPALQALFPLRYEPALYAEAQPLGSLLDAGVTLALGSDAFGPFAPNPWVDVLLATTHQARPAEALTMAQALDAYSRAAAEVRQLQGAGTLEEGNAATFAVLSQDPFTTAPPALPATTSVLTVVRGEVAWSDGTLAPATP